MTLITASICFNSLDAAISTTGTRPCPGQGLVVCVHGPTHLLSLDMLNGYCQF